MTITVTRGTGAGLSNRPYSTDALDDAVAALQPLGASGYYRPGAAADGNSWSPVVGGRLALINRLKPGNRFQAPVAAQTPTIVDAQINGLPIARFASALQQYLSMTNPTAQALGTSAGFLFAILKTTTTVTNIVIGNSVEITTPLKPPNVQMQVSGATEMPRVVNAAANATVVAPSPSIDFGNGAFRQLLLSWTAAEWGMWVDGVAVPLSAATVFGFDTGVFDIAKRGSTYGDFDLAALVTGAGTSLIGSLYDSYRNRLFTGARTVFAVA